MLVRDGFRSTVRSRLGGQKMKDSREVSVRLRGRHSVRTGEKCLARGLLFETGLLELEISDTWQF